MKSRLLNSIVSGFGHTFGGVVGAQAGVDVYQAAKRQLQNVDWKQLKDDGLQTIDQLAEKAGRLTDDLSQSVRGSRQSTSEEGRVVDFPGSSRAPAEELREARIKALERELEVLKRQKD